MSRNLSPRVQAVILLLLVALSGAAAGVMLDRLIGGRPAAGAATAEAPPSGPWRWEPRLDVRYGERLYGALELTDEQRAAVDSIIAEQQVRIRALNEEVRPRFRAIAEQTRGQIEAVLTTEQRARLHELREARVRALREDVRLRGRRPGMWGPEGLDTAGAPPRGGMMRDGPLRDRLRRERALRDSLRRDGLERHPVAPDSLRERQGRAAPGRSLEPSVPRPAGRAPGSDAPRRITLSFRSPTLHLQPGGDAAGPGARECGLVVTSLQRGSGACDSQALTG